MKNNNIDRIVFKYDPANVTDIAWTLRRNDDDTRKALDQLQSAGLVDLTDDQVTVCRFGSEQGPSQADKRQEWAMRQQKKRDRAKAKKAGADQNSDSDAEKEKRIKKEENQDSEKEKEADKTQTKTKSVTRRSRDNHAIVTRDTVGVDVYRDYGNEILQFWNELHGQEYNPSQSFWQMITYWIDQEKLDVKYARSALIQTQNNAETPMYVRDIAVQLRDETVRQNTPLDLDQFRRLYLDQKKTNGDTDDDTGGDE